MQATPKWADQAAIAEFYAEARRITADTGIPHHVDHKAPLQSKLVCGLHVHQNLQIMTAYENKRKSNKILQELLSA